MSPYSPVFVAALDPELSRQFGGTKCQIRSVTKGAHGQEDRPTLTPCRFIP